MRTRSCGSSASKPSTSFAPRIRRFARGFNEHWLLEGVGVELTEAIARGQLEHLDAEALPKFHASASELFDRIVQIADNAGAIDEHRALNYLAVRYPAIYAKAAEAHEGNASLTRVEVRPSRLTGVRKVVDVIFSYTHRQHDVTDKHLVRVDVTEEFPFLVTKLSPYYDR